MRVMNETKGGKKYSSTIFSFQNQVRCLYGRFYVNHRVLTGKKDCLTGLDNIYRTKVYTSPKLRVGRRYLYIEGNSPV